MAEPVQSSGSVDASELKHSAPQEGTHQDYQVLSRWGAPRSFTLTRNFHRALISYTLLHIFQTSYCIPNTLYPRMSSGFYFKNIILWCYIIYIS